MSTEWTEPQSAPAGAQAGSRIAIWSWLLTAVTVGAWSLTISSVPGINEPHYLTKARHFVDPQWCERDFFLQSADVHTVFFALAGPLTTWLSFSTTAVIGRLLSAMLIAWGWRHLMRACGIADRWVPFSAAMMLILARGLSIPAEMFGDGFVLPVGGHFSGEWIVGAFESKVPSFAFVFASIAAALRRRWICSGFCAGFATAFHPVVGGWLLLALIFAAIFSWLRILRDLTPVSDPPGEDGVSSPRWLIALRFGIPFAIASAPGLIPAIHLLLDPAVSKKQRDTANFIQVFGRLKHHLDPYDFPLRAWLILIGLVLLITILALIRWKRDPVSADETRHRNSRRMLFRILFASALFAAVGIAIGARTVPALEVSMWQERAALLKFYPFRLLDALLPVVAALLLTERIAGWTSAIRRPMIPAIVATGIALAAAAIVAIVNPHPPAERLSKNHAADWADACAWVRGNTPDNALFLTPRSATTFKWQAHRAEFLNYKDCPQDAVGINAWNDRLWAIDAWSRKSSADGRYHQADLRRLFDEFGINYLITRRMGPVESTPLFENQTWRVYACEL